MNELAANCEFIPIAIFGSAPRERFLIVFLLSKCHRREVIE